MMMSCWRTRRLIIFKRLRNDLDTCSPGRNTVHFARCYVLPILIFIALCSWARQNASDTLMDIIMRTYMTEY